MEEFTICVQCRARDQGDGTFIAQRHSKTEAGWIPVSPVFDGLAELFPWMKKNGWIMEEHVGDKFIPWRVVKI